MIFEYQTGAAEPQQADAYLNLMDLDGWELVRFLPIPFSAAGQTLQVLILHRRPVDPDQEAAHIRNIRGRKEAA